MPVPTRPLPVHDAAPAGPEPADRYTPRRRYPWHDDPHYDPAAHRRVPDVAGPDPGPSWPPPGHPRTGDARDSVPWTEAGPPPVLAPARGTVVPDPTVLAPEPDPDRSGGDPPGRPPQRMPRKLTVTRVAALRSREITSGGIRAFRRAATADGADRSGLTALTWPTMVGYGVDAALAVALANTLFFAAATAESKTNVALYLAITVAPFAVVAPVIGPLLDRLQRGRRVALAASFVARGVLAVVMAFNYENWLLYPAALGVMVLSKSFHVLKAAVTPRVVPSGITLATTNSRLTTFGLVAGGIAGAFAAGIAALTGSAGALFFIAALCVGGTVLCLRIPAWVESTAGEIPAALRRTARGRRRPVGRHVAIGLWGAGGVRVLTGFLTLFCAFAVREQAEGDATRQLLLIGIIGASAGLGSFAGNAAGSRQRFARTDPVVAACVSIALCGAVFAALLPGVPAAAVCALIAATCSALAKVCVDAVIQRDLPEESRASAFGRSETVLQLAWVFGGAVGVLLPHDSFTLGFAVVAGLLVVPALQTALLLKGRTLLPFRIPREG